MKTNIFGRIFSVQGFSPTFPRLTCWHPLPASNTLIFQVIVEL